MSALTLAASTGCPVCIGDTVRVETPVELPSGRVLRRGTYPVAAIESRDEGFAVVVHARLEVGKGRPMSATTGIRLDPGQWAHFASGSPEPIPDASYQTA